MYRTKDTKKKHDIPERLETLYNINIEKHYITYILGKRFIKAHIRTSEKSM